MPDSPATRNSRLEPEPHVALKNQGIDLAVKPCLETAIYLHSYKFPCQ